MIPDPAWFEDVRKKIGTMPFPYLHILLNAIEDRQRELAVDRKAKGRQDRPKQGQDVPLSP